MPKPSSRRRKLLQAAGAASLALAFPYIRTSRAAGSLSVGFWDHWVPGANDALTKICMEWAAREKVDLRVDYITTQGFKLQLTGTSEYQARAGHDILAFSHWDQLDKSNELEPMDDVMAALEKQNGKVITAAEYLNKVKGHWIAVPSPTGTQVKPPCARLDIWKQVVGLDFQAIYPASGKPTQEAENWTWDTLLKAAPKLQQAGHPIGLGLGQTADSVDWTGALFHSFGADLVDRSGESLVKKNDAVRMVLEYMQQLVKYMPPDVFAWDDSSNNKYLISGQGSLIMNPPSAWSVAKRDNPKVAEQCWTFSMPAGPRGRFCPYDPLNLGTWKFSRNKSAAKSLLHEIWQRRNVEKLDIASNGYDIPSFESMRDFPVWEEVGPPKGTVYHYPPREDQIPWVSGSPAPANIANQMYVHSIMTKMIAKCTIGGDSIAKTLEWAASEIEGYSRS